MRFSFLNSLAFTLLICLFSCNSSTKDNTDTNSNSTTTSENTNNSSETNTETVVEFSPEDANKEGGFFTISFGEEKSNIKTDLADNGLFLDKDSGVTSIMTGNADTSMSIGLKGGTTGEFPINNDENRSATVNINMTTTSGTMGGALTKGTVTITELDKTAGTAAGEFSGNTADGKEVKGEFKLNLKKM